MYVWILNNNNNKNNNNNVNILFHIIGTFLCERVDDKFAQQ